MLAILVSHHLMSKDLRIISKVSLLLLSKESYNCEHAFMTLRYVSGDNCIYVLASNCFSTQNEPVFMT